MFDGANVNPEPDNEIIRDLRRGRNRVAQPGGWCQGTSFNGRGFCMGGAVEIGAHTRDRAHVRALRDTLAETIDDYSIAAWNDHPGRTQAEVVAAFDATIAREIRKEVARLQAKELAYV